MLSVPLLLLLLLWDVGSHGFPVTPEIQQEDAELVQKYLESYYNLNNGTQAGKQKRSIATQVEQLEEMQKFFGLKMTGKPDKETLNVMKQPRCGVPDVGWFTTMPGNPLWRNPNLTYRIMNYTPLLPKSVVDDSIKKAFELWSEFSPLTFTRIFQGEADIMISFIRGDHGDNNPFDGPGNRLAHAFGPGPRLGGDAHFDLDETWTDELLIEDFSKYNLYYVAAHEFGHSLGLGHSSDIASLMYPTYQSTGDVLLGQDDVNGIQQLYGTPVHFSKKKTLKAPQVCNSDLTFNAITTVRGEVMFFQDRFYLRPMYNNEPEEVNFIAVFWPHLPSLFDAAYECDQEDKILFFKGSKYWAVQGLDALPGYPKDIYSTFGFPNTVKQIDAAASDAYTGKTYFFVDNKYWRYDESKRSMDEDYPKMIADDFPGIGSKVDAAFCKDEIFYFFHGKKQYKFDPATKKVTTLKANSWFNCPGY
ncbi:PREDICTED: interstitial collagenase [Chinchilla lanigera]|uniref:interstitial collagenase n=1 Tax=Chinchilla lanigera TaxID=34839 RepID=UPI00038EC1CC|nr:PREDICTED: interstitial collagenase [Chinchilla lanigera]